MCVCKYRRSLFCVYPHVSVCGSSVWYLSSIPGDLPGKHARRMTCVRPGRCVRSPLLMVNNVVVGAETRRVFNLAQFNLAETLSSNGSG